MKSRAVSALITYLQELGLTGYAVFSFLMVFLQVVPIAAAFVLTVSAGAIFGAVKVMNTIRTARFLSRICDQFPRLNLSDSPLTM
ncbi:MAG: hypothetical protein SGPRY_001141 [Prymnesium sp.]